MSKQNIKGIQHCILKVNISCKCQGCEKKVKKALLKTQGVVEVTIDLEQGKVFVVGDVDPNELIKNLKKHSFKDAVICSVSKDRNHIAKKNDNDDGKKSIKDKGCFLGPFYFGFGKKSSKNGGAVAQTSKNNSNSTKMNSHDSENHHHQRMQMQPSSYDQQKYMAMMNQQQRNMNMYPSNMMYGGSYSSMN